MPDIYTPTLVPWLSDDNFRRYYDIAAPRTSVSIDRCHVLYSLMLNASQVRGYAMECGVYKGGTAAMMAAILADYAPSKGLYLFDTFAGMPPTDHSKDEHRQGDFSDTTEDEVAEYVGNPERTVIRKGFIPDTFKGLESSAIAFAHVDVDIYQSVLDCAKFIWPRLSVGGFIVFDDYGFPSCKGAKMAVDEFFACELCKPICLLTGQAIAFKSVSTTAP